MGAPHKHAAVIKAWAEGAPVQIRSRINPGLWTAISRPSFQDHREYRVDPAAFADRPLINPFVGVDLADLSRYPFKAFLSPGDAYAAPASLTGQINKPAPTFAPGARVWVFPGTSYGFEATVERNTFEGLVQVRRSDSGSEVFVDAHFVAAFDVNHNQKRAYARGKQIQARSLIPGSPHCDWTDCVPVWDTRAEYRVKPDELELVKEASAAGKKIQSRCKGTSVWHDCDVAPIWASRLFEYRVKPEPVVVTQTVTTQLCDRSLSGTRAAPVDVTFEITKTDDVFTAVVVKGFK